MQQFFSSDLKLLHIGSEFASVVWIYIRIKNPFKHTTQKSIDIDGFVNPNQNANYISNLLMVLFQITNTEYIFAINNHYALLSNSNQIADLFVQFETRVHGDC